MIEQVSNSIEFAAFFVESKVGKTGLTVTVDIYRGATAIVTGASATEIGGGLYRYVLASGSTGTAGNYYAIFKTATTTVDAQHIAGVWTVGVAGVEYLDDPISSRASGDPLANEVPGAYAEGTGGYALGKLVDATVDNPVVVPSPPDDAEMCGCYIYTETILGAKVAGIQISIRLSGSASNGPAVQKGPVVLTTDADGYAFGVLHRTDTMTPAGRKYYATCSELGWFDRPFVLEDSTFDLGGINQ